jgi:23S rRNA pseudouridine1911/1915/1917 synthase
MRKNIYRITAETTTERLDTFISLTSSLTRSFIQKLIRQGLITVNAQKEKAGYRIKEGDYVEMTIPDEPEKILTPEDIPLDIIWEDAYIIAVNKPPHMVIYPAAGNRSGTMMNALISKCKKLSSIGAPLRPGVVHRLDKDTSGVIVIAKDDASYYSLSNQFKKREIEKQYLALLFGNLKDDQGEINVPIGRSESDRKKMSTKARRGKEAVTHFHVMKRYPSATLAKIWIVTGRTHQIRVHFASIGNPVLGDKTYGRKTSLKLGQKTINFTRQMLHAYSLKLRHPASGQSLELTVPMPEDMEKAIEEIVQYS